IRPAQAAVPATQRRHRDGPDIEPPDLFNQRGQARVDVLQARIVPPVPLGRKVDDVFRMDHPPGREDLHASWLDLAGAAGALVERKVLRERLLELKSDALSHDPDAVDGVHQGFCVCLEKVALCALDHGWEYSGRSLTSPAA